MKPAMINPMPMRKTKGSTLTIIKIDVIRPNVGNNGSFPMDIGDLNPFEKGCLYLRKMTEEFTRMNTAKMVKFVRFATVCISPMSTKHMDAATTPTIAIPGDLVRSEICENSLGSPFSCAMP